jgi:hypothetical protein
MEQLAAQEVVPEEGQELAHLELQTKAMQVVMPLIQTLILRLRQVVVEQEQLAKM